MDSFELNKMAGAVLFAALIVFGIREVSNVVNPEPHAEARGYVVEGVELADLSSGEEEAVAEPSLAELLAVADAANGAKVFRKCATCHTIDNGGANRVGPNLYDTVGAAYGHIDGFNYSNALMDAGGTWGYEELDDWIENPRAFIPGNKMAYGGIRDAQDRADLILYMRDNTANPPPLPVAAVEEPAAMPEEMAPEMPAEDGEDAPAAEGEEAPAEDAPGDETPAGEGEVS